MEVDYPRVTHPFAGLLTLAGFLPRLACVRHAASVRSEPGSNSPIEIPIRASTPGADVTSNFTQSIAVSAIFFVDLLSSFQRPSEPHNRLQATDLPGARCLRRPSSPLWKGGAVYLPSAA